MGHWNGDRDCEFAQLNSLLVDAEDFLVAAYRAGSRSRGQRSSVGLNPGVPTLTGNLDEARRRAEALFKKEKELREGEQGMAKYQAELRAMQEKTARLQAVRLARDAANQNSALVKRKVLAASRPRKHLLHRGG